MATFIVLPVFNVESTIVPFVEDLLSEIDGLQVVCSEDGSSDNTRRVIEERFSCNDRVMLLENSPRKGYALAVVDGIRSINGSSGDIVIFTDSDAQISAKEVCRVYTQFLSCRSARIDIMTGCRAARADGHTRLVMSRMWYLVVKLLWPSIRLRDPSSPMVVTSLDTATKIVDIWLELGRRKIEGFWWQFQAIAIYKKLKVVECEVKHSVRSDGQATQVYTARKITGIVSRNLIDLIRLRLRLL